MSRTFEARLAKVEQAIVTKARSHEDWIAILATEPHVVEGAATTGAEIVAKAIAEFGSLAAAAVAARAKARRTRDPLDDFLAADLECRAA